MIKEYEAMLGEYKHSLELLQNRIAELNKKITEGHADSENILLSERRYRLYREVWELESDMRQINEYVQCVSERKIQSH